MKVPDGMLDAALGVAFVPPISENRRADMRKALRAVLPMVRERMLDGLTETSNAGRIIMAAFDYAFPEEN